MSTWQCLRNPLKSVGMGGSCFSSSSECSLQKALPWTGVAVHTSGMEKGHNPIYSTNSQIECKTLLVLPRKSQAQLLLLCRYFRKRVVIMKHHSYRSPLRKYWSPKKGITWPEIDFHLPQKATRSPTSSPTCKSISQQVTQHAGRSPQKGTLSLNKFTNMQEILES